MNEVKKANGGYIVITLHIDDTTKLKEPILKHYASQNLDYETVTKLLEHSVKERKKVTAKKTKTPKQG